MPTEIIQFNTFDNIRVANIQVEIFEYTIHVSPASLECKCGGILIRRGSKPYSLLVHLFISETILSITSAALSEILTAYEARMPKNSSKHAKIRKLLTLADVKETLGDHGVARMEQKLQEIEKSRSSKKRERESRKPKMLQCMKLESRVILFFGEGIVESNHHVTL